MPNFFHNTVYVRIQPERLAVLHVESGKEMADIPALAIENKNGKSAVIAVGRDASVQAAFPNITVANGFRHPRTLLADFTVAQQTLKRFLKAVLPGTWWMPSPIMVLHPLDPAE